MKKIKFGDNLVTIKAKKTLERLYAQKELGLPGVIEFECDDEEYETLNSLRQHTDDMWLHYPFNAWLCWHSTNY